MRLAQNADRVIPELARYQRLLLTAGGAGAAVSLVGLILDRRQFFQSFLMTFMLLLGATRGNAVTRERLLISEQLCVERAPTHPR